jgi:hypothetical protein
MGFRSAGGHAIGARPLLRSTRDFRPLPKACELRSILSGLRLAWATQDGRSPTDQPRPSFSSRSHAVRALAEPRLSSKRRVRPEPKSVFGHSDFFLPQCAARFLERERCGKSKSPAEPLPNEVAALWLLSSESPRQKDQADISRFCGSVRVSGARWWPDCTER